MPPFGPISLREFVAALRKAGFSGPHPGAKHPYMVRGTLSLRVPNPHAEDIGRELLSRLLKQAGISRGEWERL